MKNLTLAALGLVAMAAAVPASAANWSDTYLGYQYSSQFRDPGILSTEVKSRIELSGVYGWDYGSNFFDVNMLAASKSDPANNSTGQAKAGVPGDTEVYVVYRSNFDLGKIFKTKMAFGPVREVDFTVGFDFDSTDNQFASNKKFMMAGPQFGFDISKGFWNLGVGACRESNYNGIPGIEKEVNFKTTGMVWTAWHKSFDIGVPLVFKGWANYIGAKGKDGFGVDTKVETLGDAYLLVDISRIFGRKDGAVLIGPGYEYWNNKFGGRNVTATASDPWNNNQQVNALMFSAEIHF
jgi:nucleoside-specific outer membrane channel protein Tsx